jgi:hypothetical protein
MTKERWMEIKDNIKEKFEITNQGDEHLEDEGGVDIEFVEFDGPLGKMRLELVSKPVILDKKMTYSKRIGSETKIDYVYSETEKSENMTAYKWDDAVGDWMEMDGKMFE